MVVKCLKVTSPFITNHDSASPVIGKTFVVGIGATLYDAYPDLMNGMLSHTVCCIFACSDLLLQAATRFCVPRDKAISQWSHHVATVALAQPNNAFLAFANWPKRDKTTESLIGYIFGILGEGDKIVGHQNLQFWRLIRERLVIVARYFYGVFVSLIIPQRKQEEHIGYTI